MTLADIQRQLNGATDTKTTLQVIDNMTHNELHIHTLQSKITCLEGLLKNTGDLEQKHIQTTIIKIAWLKAQLNTAVNK